MIKLVGLVNSSAAELVDIWYQFDRPWTAEDGRFQRAFGYQPATPYKEGISATVDWYRQRQKPLTGVFGRG